MTISFENEGSIDSDREQNTAHQYWYPYPILRAVSFTHSWRVSDILANNRVVSIWKRQPPAYDISIHDLWSLCCKLFVTVVEMNTLPRIAGLKSILTTGEQSLQWTGCSNAPANCNCCAMFIPALVSVRSNHEKLLKPLITEICTLSNPKFLSME
jgi:hypothetical protein